MSIDTFDTSGDAFRPSIPKDPDAILDYTFNWTAWLDEVTDTIVVGAPPASYEIFAVGVTLDSDALDATRKMITVFLSAGSLTSENYVTCRIHTAGGRTEDRTIYLDIIDR